MDSEETKTKAIDQRIKGTTLVRSLSKDEPNENSNKEDVIKRKDSKRSKNPNKEIMVSKGTRARYCSKSEECLVQTFVEFRRNISDTRLSERRIRDTKCKQIKHLESQNSATVSGYESDELDQVELRKITPSNFKRVISQRVRDSIRIVRGMRPKSENDVQNKEKKNSKYQLHKQHSFTPMINNNSQPSSTSNESSTTSQPPAPLVVEEPPSTEDEPLHDLKNQNPAFLNGSSGNFAGSGGGPRSAPVTPQGGQLGGAPPGGLPESLVIPTPTTIQRSPSHSHFSKNDKSNLKHLSTSAPTMTAQGQLAEPPSPKAVKDPKVHTTSKARQKKFLRHFPNVEEDEKVLNHYSCALIGDILLQGHLYITKNYFAFYSNVFGYVTKLLIPILTVEEITKEKTARIIPNAVGITTSEDKHIFGSLMSRDNTLAYMKTVWEKAKREEVLPDPEIVEADQDSSESGESERESPTPDAKPSTDVLASAKFDRIRKESVRNQAEALERKNSKGFIRTLKDAISEFRKLPRQGLILVATTFLLILLFLSAAVLLYRINKIQNKYSISLQGNSFPSTSEDIYSDLLQWQTHLHSKSADAVNNFLDNNLDQIAKVRQSLEALTTLLTGHNNNSPSEDGSQHHHHSEPTMGGSETTRNSEPATIISSES